MANVTEPSAGRRRDLGATPAPREKSGTGADWRSSAKTLATVLKSLFPYAVLVFALFHWGAVDQLLKRVDYFKYGGFEARMEAARKADQIATDAVASNVKAFQGFERRLFDTALRHYVRVGPAVTGARVLWVDPNPGNQRYERHLLSTLGIAIDVERDTASAIKRVQETRYDLVVSNISTPESDQARSPSPRPLVRCPAAFLAVNGVPRSVDERPGMIRAEMLAAEDPEWFSGARPRIIFYSASGAGNPDGVIADKCARLVTNRAAVLLEGAISALAELRASSLPPIQKSGDGQQYEEEAGQ